MLSQRQAPCKLELTFLLASLSRGFRLTSPMGLLTKPSAFALRKLQTTKKSNRPQTLA